MREFNLTGKVKASQDFWWLNEESQTVLERGYLLEGESVRDAVIRITTASAKRLNNMELQPLFQKIIERGWMSLASPIWANMGNRNNKRGLSISCFNSHYEDTMDSIIEKNAEVSAMTSFGGGTSGYFGDIRARGEKIRNNGESNGAVAFMEIIDTMMSIISQGSTRKGAFASYLPIDHGDVEEFLSIKDIGHPIQNLFTGVTITDKWMEEMIAGDSSKRKIWAKVLESRQQKGLPYLFFTDNVNKANPDIYKVLRKYVSSSNLCTEVLLSSTPDESFVCCLSSMNLELYEEWKDTDAVFLATMFLDGVMEEFIQEVKEVPFMKNTYNFASRNRALGLGVLGYHSYLQKNMIPFESMEAKFKNTEIFKFLEQETTKASLYLAEVYGHAPIFDAPEAKDLVKYRNTHRMAVAPTTSSSAILGQVSAGIEPLSSNYYKAGLSKGNFMRRNKHLVELLIEKGKDNEDVWRQIMMDGGSVAKLDFLSKEEKDVFKTFREINQVEILNQAVARQKFIDQGQSLNLNIPPDVPVKDVNRMYIDYWKNGGKTLYYQRSLSVAKELVTSLVSCSSCEA